MRDCDEIRHKNHFATSDLSTTAKMTLTVVEMFDNRVSANLLLNETEYRAPQADFVTNEHTNE